MTDILKIKNGDVWVGIPAIRGEDGLGVPAGGTIGQALVKKTNDDNDTEWKNVGTVTSVNNVSPVNGNVTIDALPSQTGNSGKFLTTNGTDASWNIPKTHKLFEFMWSDYILNDVSWLRADTFSWHAGEVYTLEFDHLLNDVGYVRYMKPDDGLDIKFYRSPSDDTEMFAWTNQFSTLYTESEFPENGDDFYYHNQVFGTVLSTGIEAGSGVISSSTETVGSYTITYYRASDGHKIVLADQETTVANIYSETGVAWYYILDTTNTRFKLPRTKFGFEGLRTNAGDLIEAGLPNITGSLTSDASSITGAVNEHVTASGALQKSGTVANNIAYSASSAVGVQTITLDASNSSSIYSNSTTVQEQATQMYLYFYAGNFSQSAIEQTAGLNSELFNGKADVDLSNINASSSAKNTITGWGLPDYANAISYTNDTTTHIAPSNGYVLINYCKDDVSANSGKLYINNIAVGDTLMVQSYCTTLNGMYPVSMNDTFYISDIAENDAGRNFIYKFVPMKGAN